MTTELARLARRHLRRHPWQVGLAVVGIALGVAVAVSIDLANESARRAFEHAAERVGGRATHQIVAGPAGVQEEVYRDLRVRAGVRHAAPVLERDVALVDRPGRVLRLLGVDPFAEAVVRDMLVTPAAARRASCGR